MESRKRQNRQSDRRLGDTSRMDGTLLYRARSGRGASLKKRAAGHLGQNLDGENGRQVGANLLNRALALCWAVSSIAAPTLVLAGCSGKSSSQSSGGLTIE